MNSVKFQVDGRGGGGGGEEGEGGELPWSDVLKDITNQTPCFP